MRWIGMLRVIIAGFYFLVFSFTPIAVRRLTQVNPFEYTRGFVNVQSFNDLAHVGALTLMVFTGITKLVPFSVLVYFFLDILFNLKSFILNTNYLGHHVFSFIHIYLANKYYMNHMEILAFLLWLQETALIPIIIMDIFRMQSLRAPAYMYILRALWYFSTRLYTYGFFFYTFDMNPIMLCFAPLILHNANVFKLQIQSMLRALWPRCA